MMLEKFIGCLICSALGDSLGARREIPSKTTSGGILRYTDDTHMTITLAKAIIEKGYVEAEHLAIRFVEDYEREPWRGYGPGPPRIFKMIRRGAGLLELDKKLYPGGSFGNGAAMRVAPVALVYHDDFSELERMVVESCRPTHSHPLGVEGAFVQAMAVALALKLDRNRQASPREFVEEILKHVKSVEFLNKLESVVKLIEEGIVNPRHVARILGNSVEAHNSVPTAIYSYLVAQNPVKSIEIAIRIGGDTDTIACMTGAIAGAHKTHLEVPAVLMERLENREYIEQIAKELWETYRRRKNI